jgi:hypothetical protein
MQAELGSGLPTGVEQQLNRGGRGAARNEEVALLRQQLIVQTRENGFMVLTYYAPLRNREEAMRTFEAVVGSFEILNRDEWKKRRIDAILLGKKWLSERSAEEFRSKMNNQPTYYRMLVGGAAGIDVGFWWQEERDATRDGFKGVEVAVNSISFPTEPPGTIIQGKNISFWANSRNEKGETVPHYSMWDNISRTDVRLPGQKEPARLEDKSFWIEESGTLMLEGNGRINQAALRQLQEEREKFIRDNPTKPPPPPIPTTNEQFHMIVNLSGDKAQRLPAGLNKVFPPHEAAALPKAFEYMWPRLIDVTKPSEMSFGVFNSATKTLALRSLIVTGKRERIAINGRSVDCWKCIDELDPGSTTLWVDDTGRILMMRTSDQSVMVPTTRQEMERLWAGRLSQVKP